MADYYPLLVRAIAGLPSNTAEKRKMMFDRARNTLLKQLRGVEPPLPEGEITRERQSLEEAIRRIEAEQKTLFPAVEPPAAAEPPPPEKPAAPPPEPAPSGTEPPRRRLGESPARPAFPPPPADEVPDAADDAATDQRPTLGKPKVASRTARPRMPASDDGKTSGRGRRTLIYFALAIVAVGGIALAVVNHETLEQLVFSRAAPPPGPATQGADASRPASEPAKSADRVAQASGDAARRPPPMPLRPTSGTQRAVLFEESASGPQGLQSYEGTVTWKT
ncbi:MAG: hypothetical protein B7Y61_21570, partial [Rhizobiales bacterium 35-66-30]